MPTSPVASVAGLVALSNSVIPTDIDTLVEEAAAYARGARAASSRRAYQLDWDDFLNWCAQHGRMALPAEPSTVVLYMTALARTRKVSTIERRLAAISKAHTRRGLVSPTGDPAVRLVMSGIRRDKNVAPRRVAPIRAAHLRAIVGRIPPTRSGRRDRALLLVGFQGALRRSELVALDRTDVTFTADGVTLRIRRSKTDQEGAGADVAIPFGTRPETCAVQALRSWLMCLDDGAPAIFRGVGKGDRVSCERLSAQSVALVVKQHAAGLGLPGEFAGHSLRAGFATSAAAGNATERDIMRQTRHKSAEMVRRYIRDGELFSQANAARFTGL
jgi:integrase